MYKTDSNQKVVYEKLYQDHHREIYVYLRRFLGDTELAADIMQESFISFYQYYNTRPLPEDLTRCKGLLYRIATNLSRNHLKSFHRNKVEFVAEYRVEPSENPGHSSTETGAIERESLEELQDMLLELPVEQRRLLTLRYIQSLKLEEIAAILKISVSAVSRQIKKAEKSLLSLGRKRNFNPFGDG